MSNFWSGVIRLTSAFSDRLQGSAGLLALGLLLGAAPAAAAQAPTPPAGPPGKTHVMEVMGLAADPATGQPVVILRTKDDKRELTMFIGPFEAQGIALPLQGQTLPRPYTHDLMVAMLRQMNATLVKVVITDLRDNTYFATLHLRSQGRDIELDSRPSDALALALRVNAPILADERVFQRPAPAPDRPEGR